MGIPGQTGESVGEFCAEESVPNGLEASKPLRSLALLRVMGFYWEDHGT